MWIYLFIFFYQASLYAHQSRVTWCFCKHLTCTGFANWHCVACHRALWLVSVPHNPRLWFSTWRSVKSQKFSCMGSLWRQFLFDMNLCWRWQEGLMTKDSCQRKAPLPRRVSVSGRLVDNVSWSWFRARTGNGKKRAHSWWHIVVYCKRTKRKPSFWLLIHLLFSTKEDYLHTEEEQTNVAERFVCFTGCRKRRTGKLRSKNVGDNHAQVFKPLISHVSENLKELWILTTWIISRESWRTGEMPKSPLPPP